MKLRPAPFNPRLVDTAVAEPLTAFPVTREWLRATVRSASAMFYLTAVAAADPAYRSSGGTRVVDRVVEHYRNMLDRPGNEPGCSGGLDTTSISLAFDSFAIAKTVPAIWAQLSPTGKDKITLLVQAALVASHWLHHDGNDFDTGIDQRGNTNKNWNPNHVEGGLGMGLAASYFLGASRAGDFLLAFDADAFLRRLEAADLASTHWVFSQTPTTTLTAATRGEFTYHGDPLTRPWRWLLHRAQAMYAKVVAPSGAGGRGHLVTGAESLPNVGQAGMATEFDSFDAEGLRSDIQYVSLGWHNSLANLYTFTCLHGVPQAPETADLLRRYEVGTIDLLYKARHGYRSYSLGKVKGTLYEADLHDAMGLYWHRDLWAAGPATRTLSPPLPR